MRPTDVPQFLISLCIHPRTGPPLNEEWTHPRKRLCIVFIFPKEIIWQLFCNNISYWESNLRFFVSDYQTVDCLFGICFFYWIALMNLKSIWISMHGQSQLSFNLYPIFRSEQYVPKTIRLKIVFLYLGYLKNSDCSWWCQFFLGQNVGTSHFCLKLDWIWSIVEKKNNHFIKYYKQYYTCNCFPFVGVLLQYGLVFKVLEKVSLLIFF